MYKRLLEMPTRLARVASDEEISDRSNDVFPRQGAVSPKTAYELQLILNSFILTIASLAVFKAVDILLSRTLFRLPIDVGVSIISFIAIFWSIGMFLHGARAFHEERMRDDKEDGRLDSVERVRRHGPLFGNTTDRDFWYQLGGAALFPLQAALFGKQYYRIWFAVLFIVLTILFVLSYKRAKKAASNETAFPSN